MKTEYRQWINENVKEAYGKCVETTLAMTKAFPELIRVRGHYQCPLDGKRPHWWLKTSDGGIVDPTASQFSSGGVMGEYEGWVEGSPEPTGKCMNCGGYCYNNSNFCTQKCLNSLSDANGWERCLLK
jgi:hypothetical protein